MKYFSILLLSIIYIYNINAEDVFFYDNGTKMIMHQSDKYIAVKFAPDESDVNKNIITHQLTGDAFESTVDFGYSHLNNNRQSYVIIKLKDNTGDSKVNDVIKLLLLQKQVLFAGRAYVYNDHVIHITTNEVIVKFKKNVTSFEVNNLARTFKTSVIEKLNFFDNTYVISGSSRGEEGSDNPFDISNKFVLTPFVEFAQPNFIRIGMLTVIPNDTLIPHMWNIHNTGNNYPGINTTPGCDTRVDTAWSMINGNKKVLIGIVDTGTDTNHYDLKNILSDRNLWYNAVDENQDPQDGHSHGTAMCGIAGAEGNNIAGIAGVAWGCTILPIRIFTNQGFTTDLVLGKGLNWGWTHGADVLSNSWGGGIPSPFIEHAIRNAVTYGRNGKGTVVFAATGNDDNDTIYFPSRMPEVIAIGGVSPCEQRKSPTSCDGQNWGSNYGENLSVMAPTPGIGCTSLGGGWSTGCNGTSSSCPQAAAIGALMLTKNINLSIDSVRLIIERTARKIGNYSYSINRPNGMWNNEMGYGMINAAGALIMTPQGPNAIYDQVPPVIKVFSPPPGDYSNSEITISAEIYDNQFLADGINAPRMYYNSTYNGNFIPVTGVRGSGNNIFNFIIPKFKYGTSFTYYIAAQDTSSNHNVTTFPYGGSGINPPGRIAPLKKIYLQSAGIFDTNLVSANVPIPISQLRETTFVSVLNNPISAVVAGMRCTININHTFDADLTLSLISPKGTEIVLLSGVGWDGDNFINTVLDDYAAGSITDTNYHAPFTGNFRPVENLWMFNGENSSGEWKLKVVDDGYGDGGVLNVWNITFVYPMLNNQNLLPVKSELINNYPNPFNPYTRILFNLSKRANVKIKLYDVSGREVATLINEIRDAGYNQFVDLRASALNGGKGIASGIYFYTMLVDDEFIESRKMALVK